MGPVTPLLAVNQELESASVRGGFKLVRLWVGTRRGPEKNVIAFYGIPYRAIASAKLRRAMDVRNLFMPFFLFLGFIQGLIIILRFRPTIFISAGGFVSVPLAWAAWLLAVPIIIHQEDRAAGLANLLMAPASRMVTTAFYETAQSFPHPKTRCVGNPVRAEIREAAKIDAQSAKDFFGFKMEKPVLLVLGGGTGAAALNDFVFAGKEELKKYFQVLHLTGIGKGEAEKAPRTREEDYRAFEFLSGVNMGLAYRAADLVVSRAGMGVISELSELGLPAVLAPIPETHQEVNAKYLEEKKAVLVLKQAELGAKTIPLLKNLFEDKKLMAELRENIKKIFPRDAAHRLADFCIQFSKKGGH